MIASKKSPFQRGYGRGYLAARDFFLSLRARIVAGEDIAPNELGCLLDRLHRRMDAAGGRAKAERPLLSRRADYQSLRGEFFGFCAGLIDVLRRP